MYNDYELTNILGKVLIKVYVVTEYYIQLATIKVFPLLHYLQTE